MRARQQREIYEQLRNAYAGQAGELLDEIGDLVDKITDACFEPLPEEELRLWEGG